MRNLKARMPQKIPLISYHNAFLIFSSFLISILITSCNSMQPLDVLQCSPYMAFISIEGKRYIDPDNSVCLCRTYRYSKAYIGPMSESTNNPIEFCNKIIGNPVEDYIRLTNYLEEARRNLNGGK